MKSLLYSLLSLVPIATNARIWTDIETFHSQNPKDVSGLSYLMEEDPLYENTLTPTAAPTTLPPTPQPTTTFVPSSTPSVSPSAAPSSTPTENPDPYPPNDVPPNPDPWYFNYDTSRDAKYGPGYPGLVQGNNGNIVLGFKNNGWTNAGNAPYPYNNLLEFTDNGYGPWNGVLGNRDPLANRCGRVGQQSPIDLRESGATCDEHHEVRSRVSTSRSDAPFDK